MADNRTVDADIFRRWKTLWQEQGLPLLQARQEGGHRPPPHIWPRDAATRLMAAGRRQLEVERVQLSDLLAASRRRLAPFGDPLELDLGVHRWLAHDREEAYSDWLAWILGRLTAQEIADLFEMPHLVDSRVAHQPPVRVHRELWVKQGHEGASGRLDVVIELPGNAALVLELKRGDADSADTAKQEGYFREMERSGMQCYYCLLVTDASTEDVDRFTPLRYAALCLRLRRWAIGGHNTPRSHTWVALVLAFVGAIEANFLGLKITAGLPSQAVLNHLSAFVEP